MISVSVAITFIVLIFVSLLIQPTWVLIIAVYIGCTMWGEYQVLGAKESVERLLVAIQEQDEETVRLLTSENLQEGLDMFFSAFSGEQALQLNTLIEGASVTECARINKESATCTICITSLENCEDLTLRKENNQWVVDFDK